MVCHLPVVSGASTKWPPNNALLLEAEKLVDALLDPPRGIRLFDATLRRLGGGKLRRLLDEARPAQMAPASAPQLGLVVALNAPDDRLFREHLNSFGHEAER